MGRQGRGPICVAPGATWCDVCEIQSREMRSREIESPAGIHRQCKVTQTADPSAPGGVGAALPQVSVSHRPPCRRRGSACARVAWRGRWRAACGAGARRARQRERGGCESGQWVAGGDYSAQPVSSRWRGERLRHPHLGATARRGKPHRRAAAGRQRCSSAMARRGGAPRRRDAAARRRDWRRCAGAAAMPQRDGGAAAQAQQAGSEAAPKSARRRGGGAAAAARKRGGSGGAAERGIRARPTTPRRRRRGGGAAAPLPPPDSWAVATAAPGCGR